MIDYHMHLENGPLTLDWLREFWKQAQSVGLREIGITEHAHQFKEFIPVYGHLTQNPQQYPVVQKWLGREFRYHLQSYLTLLQEARAEGIPVKFGLELDYFPETADLAASVLKDYPDFDFILGSVHFIGQWPFDFAPELGWEDSRVEVAYLDYLNLMHQLVNSGLCDVLAHLDVIKVFGHRAQKNLRAEWSSLLQAISKADLAIEVSTAGWRKPVGEIYPDELILKEAANLEIPITIASDAHYPQDVGYRWRDAVAYAKQGGYTHYCSFKGRKRFIHQLPSLELSTP